jgi:hypothetical protein
MRAATRQPAGGLADWDASLPTTAVLPERTRLPCRAEFFNRADFGTSNAVAFAPAPTEPSAAGEALGLGGSVPMPARRVDNLPHNRAGEDPVTEFSRTPRLPPT